MEKATVVTQDQLIGFVLEERYELLRIFNKDGSNGVIYLAKDNLVPDHQVLVKVTKNHEMNYMECLILKKLNEEAGQKSFPVVYGGGIFKAGQKKRRFSYIIMEMLGKTLQDYLYSRKKAFTLKNVCQVGIQLIGSLQKLHGIGYLHNDLKIENILIGNQDGEESSLIKLIDFGLASPFIDDDENHIQEGLTKFCGNIAFCSKNAMIGKTLSRRDDLISLTYLLLYLLRGSLQFMSIDQEKDGFEQIVRAKQVCTPEILCSATKSLPLLDFVKDIHKLEFDENPNYNRLQFLLLKCLSENGLSYNDEFDWSNAKVTKESNIENEQSIFTRDQNAIGKIHNLIQNKQMDLFKQLGVDDESSVDFPQLNNVFQNIFDRIVEKDMADEQNQRMDCDSSKNGKSSQSMELFDSQMNAKKCLILKRKQFHLKQ